MPVTPHFGDLITNKLRLRPQLPGTGPWANIHTTAVLQAELATRQF
jgi:hypothetical protein